MSRSVCVICRKEVQQGVICAWDFARLEETLDRAEDLTPVLESGQRGRHGETVHASTAPGIPISIAVMDAKTALGEALHGAVRGIAPRMPRLAVLDAISFIRAHRGRVRPSWIAPTLLLELEPAVAQAARAIDTPRGRISVPGRCRECGPSMLHPVGGMLACDRCGERMTVGEVRRAS